MNDENSKIEVDGTSIIAKTKEMYKVRTWSRYLCVRKIPYWISPRIIKDELWITFYICVDELQKDVEEVKDRILRDFFKTPENGIKITTVKITDEVVDSGEEVNDDYILSVAEGLDTKTITLDDLKKCANSRAKNRFITRTLNAVGRCCGVKTLYDFLSYNREEIIKQTRDIGRKSYDMCIDFLCDCGYLVKQKAD
jgi:hypothetical protein